MHIEYTNGLGLITTFTLSKWSCLLLYGDVVVVVDIDGNVDTDAEIDVDDLLLLLLIIYESNDNDDTGVDESNKDLL